MELLLGSLWDLLCVHLWFGHPHMLWLWLWGFPCSEGPVVVLVGISG